MLLKGQLEMICMLDQVSAHIEKQTSGFCWNDPVFSTGKDCKTVFLLHFPKDLAEVWLGHKETFGSGRYGATVGDLYDVFHILKIHKSRKLLSENLYTPEIVMRV